MDARLIKQLQKSIIDKDFSCMMSCISTLKSLNNSLTHSWRDYELALPEHLINIILGELRASGIEMPLHSRLLLDNNQHGNSVTSKVYNIHDNIYIVPHYPASAFNISTHQDSFEEHTGFLSLYHFDSVFLSGNLISLAIHNGTSSFTEFVVNTPEILLSEFLHCSPTPDHLAGNTFLFNHQYGTNYFHSIIEEAAKFEFYISNLSGLSVNQLIFDGPPSAWHRSFLSLGASFFESLPHLLYTSQSHFHYYLNSCYSLPFRLTLKSSIILSRSFWSRCVSRETDSIKHSLGSKFFSLSSPLIYIPRGTTGSKRAILNEALLIEKLLGLGFNILENHSTSPLEQIYLCSRASLVLGFHGAGLANSILMKPGSVILEITPCNYRTDLFPTLCSILSFDHIFCEIHDTPTKDSPITLSPSDITSIINNVRSMI